MLSISWLNLKKRKETDPLYHESLAHVIKDIILGVDNSDSQKAKDKKKEVRKRKKAVKALQNQVSAQGMITVLKAMPEPDSPLVTSTGVEVDKNDNIENLPGPDTSSSKDTIHDSDKKDSKKCEKELTSGSEGEEEDGDETN